jgi:hypothetical protein
MGRIGLLTGVADDQEGQARVAALKQGLQELGWTDGGKADLEQQLEKYRRELAEALDQVLRVISSSPGSRLGPEKRHRPRSATVSPS